MVTQTETFTTTCLDCGIQLSPASISRGGLRCRPCSNRRTAETLADVVARQDGWLLEQLAHDRSVSEIAAELGLTRAAVYARLKKAKARLG